MSRILKSSGTAGAATALSRVLGFVRTSAYAAFMGDGPVATAWMTAEQVPNLFRRLLGEGALTAAFVPTFKARLKSDGETSAWRSAAAVLCALILVTTALITLVTVVVTALLHFGAFSWRQDLMLRLLRVMFPYVLLVCSTAVFIGLLNARGRYFLPALGAAMLNVVMIASVYFLTPWFGSTPEEQIFGLAVGYLIAGVAQAAFQIPAVRAEGFRFKWVNPIRDPVVREVLTKMGPATLGAAAYQINVLTTSLFAGAVSENAVASFNYATRLMELPQGIVGISMATFLLTELSGLAVDKKFPEFRRTLTEGLLHMVFVNALALVLLVGLSQPMIRLLFEHGRFTEVSTARASGALWFLAPGLLFFSANNILARAFYALHDTRTPMMISLFCLGTNLVLVFFLAGPMQQRGMALANTLSATGNTLLLFYALKKALPKFAIREFGPALGTMASAALIVGLLAWELNRLIEGQWGTRTLGARLIGVFVPITVAALTYLGLGLWLRLPQAQEMRAALWRRGRKV